MSGTDPPRSARRTSAIVAVRRAAGRPDGGVESDQRERRERPAELVRRRARRPRRRRRGPRAPRRPGATAAPARWTGPNAPRRWCRSGRAPTARTASSRPAGAGRAVVGERPAGLEEDRVEEVLQRAGHVAEVRGRPQQVPVGAEHVVGRRLQGRAHDDVDALDRVVVGSRHHRVGQRPDPGRGGVVHDQQPRHAARLTAEILRGSSATSRQPKLEAIAEFRACWHASDKLGQQRSRSADAILPYGHHRDPRRLSSPSGSSADRSYWARGIRPRRPRSGPTRWPSSSRPSSSRLPGHVPPRRRPPRRRPTGFATPNGRHVASESPTSGPPPSRPPATRRPRSRLPRSGRPEGRPGGRRPGGSRGRESRRAGRPGREGRGRGAPRDRGRDDGARHQRCAGRSCRGLSRTAAGRARHGRPQQAGADAGLPGTGQDLRLSRRIGWRSRRRRRRWPREDPGRGGQGARHLRPRGRPDQHARVHLHLQCEGARRRLLPGDDHQPGGADLLAVRPGEVGWKVLARL